MITDFNFIREILADMLYGGTPPYSVTIEMPESILIDFHKWYIKDADDCGFTIIGDSPIPTPGNDLVLEQGFPGMILGTLTVKHSDKFSIYNND